MRISRTHRSRAWLGTLAAVAFWAPAGVPAATSTTTFAVSATVLSTCAVSASPLAFGNYAMTQTDSTTTLSVTCTNGTTYTVSLNAGTGTGASVATRKLTGPSSQTLDYSLYQDAGRASLWGETIGVDTVAGTGNGAAQSLTVYGRIPASQAPGAGAYADTITVSVTY